MCAHAVRVSLKSVPGVDSVAVSLEKGLASVKMKPGNSISLKQLNDAITNGFTMKQSMATIAGKVALENGKPFLQVSGSNQMLELVPDSTAAPAATSFDGKSVVVEGTTAEAAKGKSPESIHYRSIKDENSK